MMLSGCLKVTYFGAKQTESVVVFEGWRGLENQQVHGCFPSPDGFFP